MGKKFDYKKWVTENKYGSLNEQNGNVVLGYECPEVIPFFNNTDYCVNSSSPEYGQWVNTCCSDEGNIPLGYTCPENLPVFNPNPDQYPPNYCTNATSFSQYSYFVNACCGEEGTSGEVDCHNDFLPAIAPQSEAEFCEKCINLTDIGADPVTSMPNGEYCECCKRLELTKRWTCTATGIKYPGYGPGMTPMGNAIPIGGQCVSSFGQPDWPYASLEECEAAGCGADTQDGDGGIPVDPGPVSPEGIPPVPNKGNVLKKPYRTNKSRNEGSKFNRTIKDKAAGGHGTGVNESLKTKIKNLIKEQVDQMNLSKGTPTPPDGTPGPYPGNTLDEPVRGHMNPDYCECIDCDRMMKLKNFKQDFDSLATTYEQGSYSGLNADGNPIPPNLKLVEHLKHGSKMQAFLIESFKRCCRHKPARFS